jgi:hypothetical protein
VWLLEDYNWKKYNPIHRINSQHFPNNKWSHLHEAVVCGNFDMVKFIVEKGGKEVLMATNKVFLYVNLTKEG